MKTLWSWSGAVNCSSGLLLTHHTFTCKYSEWGGEGGELRGGSNEGGRELGE